MFIIGCYNFSIGNSLLKQLQKLSNTSFTSFCESLIKIFNKFFEF